MQDYASIFTALNKNSLKEQVKSSIEELILTNKLKPESKLPPERELAKLFNVSRPLIHEAIIDLEKNGLVRIHSRQGIYINDYTKTATLDILPSILQTTTLSKQTKHYFIDLLALLVTEFVIAATKFRQDKDLDTLFKLNNIEKSNFALLDEVSQSFIEEFSKQDINFIIALSQASQNEAFMLIANSLKKSYIAFLSSVYKTKTQIESVFGYHEELIEKIACRDTESARALVKRYANILEN